MPATGRLSKYQHFRCIGICVHFVAPFPRFHNREKINKYAAQAASARTPVIAMLAAASRSVRPLGARLVRCAFQSTKAGATAVRVGGFDL